MGHSAEKVKTCFNMTTAMNKPYKFVESLKISRLQSLHL